MFNRGFKAVNEEKERQESQKNSGGLFRFFLSKDKEEADITFLTEQPVNYYEHSLKTFINGKERYQNIPCIGEGCKHCEEGNRPSFKSAWLIVDHREVTFKDSKGETKTLQDQVRLLVYGTKVASQLDRKSERYGLTGRMYTVVRLGTGTSTSYTFEHGDKYTMTQQEIESLLPDFLKGMYDGSQESLYKIIENQIASLVEGDKPHNTKEETKPVNEEIVPTEEAPSIPPRRGLPRRNRTENSVKPSIKSLLKKN